MSEYKVILLRIFLPVLAISLVIALFYLNSCEAGSDEWAGSNTESDASFDSESDTSPNDDIPCIERCMPGRECVDGTCMPVDPRCAGGFSCQCHNLSDCVEGWYCPQMDAYPVCKPHPEPCWDIDDCIDDGDECTIEACEHGICRHWRKGTRDCGFY